MYLRGRPPSGKLPTISSDPRAKIAWSMGAWWHYFSSLPDAVDTIFDHWGNTGDLQASHGSGMGAPNEI